MSEKKKQMQEVDDEYIQYEIRVRKEKEEFENRIDELKALFCYLCSNELIDVFCKRYKNIFMTTLKPVTEVEWNALQHVLEHFDYFINLKLSADDSNIHGLYDSDTMLKNMKLKVCDLLLTALVIRDIRFATWMVDHFEITSSDIRIGRWKFLYTIGQIGGAGEETDLPQLQFMFDRFNVTEEEMRDSSVFSWSEHSAIFSGRDVVVHRWLCDNYPKLKLGYHAQIANPV